MKVTWKCLNIYNNLLRKQIMLYKVGQLVQTLKPLQIVYLPLYPHIPVHYVNPALNNRWHIVVAGRGLGYADIRGTVLLSTVGKPF